MGMGLLVQVENYADLRRLYGVPFASAVEQELLERVSAVCDHGVIISALGEGRIGICWFAYGDGLSISIERRDLFAENLLLALSEWAKRECGASSLAVLAVNWVPQCEVEQTEFQSRELISSPDFSHSLEDMDVVASVYHAIGDGRVELVYQPICNTNEIDKVLYNECLLRIHLENGDVLYPGQFIPSLEKLGLMRFLDNYVMRRVIESLKRHPQMTLGVNISAQSAINDIWWASVFADLVNSPDVASRLVIEITETARIYPGAGRLFCNRLRQLGCRIAIDDFGAAFGIETGLEIREPDIIKLDASALRIGFDEIGSGYVLAELVSMAQEYATQVVVEGVEIAEDLETLRRAGVLWGQGNFLARPSSRIWANRYG